jgi:phospholipase/carboxylesterase
MSTHDRTMIQLLPKQGKPAQLFILLHGVGADAEGLRPLATHLRHEFPDAVVEIPEGFSPFDAAPSGRQWFSIRGVTEQNRPGRVAEVMPALVQWVREAQERHALAAPATILIGFSQGAIMALEMAVAQDGLVGQVMAFAGRFAALPEQGPRQTKIHFFNGEEDAVMPLASARAAFKWLREQGCDITLDTFGCGHELHPALVGKAIEHVKRDSPTTKIPPVSGGSHLIRTY